jgi:hypothetical protein
MLEELRCVPVLIVPCWAGAIVRVCCQPTMQPLNPSHVNNLIHDISGLCWGSRPSSIFFVLYRSVRPYPE